MTAEFEVATENAALKERIVARIRREGAISFRDFMAMTLYEPGLGYYASPREKIGRSGDYLTSPEVSPLFGAVLARQLREMWDVLGRPGRFQAVEAGPGTGVLARDILRAAARAGGAWGDALRYTLVETSDALARRQRELLEAEGTAGRAEWRRELPPRVEGVILANELLDAMPVHRVLNSGGRLLEVYVTWDGARFGEELRPAREEVAAYFARLGLAPGEGCYAEVNLEALRWLRAAARALERGFLVVFDYGYEAAELYAPWRKDGTLLCFYRHNAGTDPYARIGRQDITAHVDFTSLRRAGEAEGLRTLGLAPQSRFLLNLGLPDALPAAAAAGPDLEDYYLRRRAVMELLDPGGLGRIRVLIQARGVEDAPLTGLLGEDG